MAIHKATIVGLAALGLFAAGQPGSALAGPCSGDILELGRKLAENPSLGPVTTGALTGSGARPSALPAAQAAAPAPTGTSADNRVGGTAGTKEVNAAVGSNIATSPQDVRRQQEGLPTAAAAASRGSERSVETTPTQGGTPGPNDRMSQAKMELEKARMLDQGDDATCSASVERTRQLMN